MRPSHHHQLQYATGVPPDGSGNSPMRGGGAPRPSDTASQGFYCCCVSAPAHPRERPPPPGPSSHSSPNHSDPAAVPSDLHSLPPPPHPRLSDVPLVPYGPQPVRTAPSAPPSDPAVLPTWRLRERMKTTAVCLCLCLNIGTDPPDVTRCEPCARRQCWLDPARSSRAKAREAIGMKLEEQYGRWQQRARYRKALDPTADEVRALATSMRRHAKGERLLFHYNGHGVPRPTPNGGGELWAFDKNYTQYIPLPVSELRGWLGGPTVVVLDCSYAAATMPSWVGRWGDSGGMRGGRRGPGGASDETIVLAPTGAEELLPQNPAYPADVFTSCLTTPIPIALRWFILQNPVSMEGHHPEDVDSIPGKMNDRKTPLGELNWIFTAVTDSIAWNVLPSPLFQRLFRQDLLVASLFRNFLLADRILRSLGCTPVSHPVLPPTASHPLWQAWDWAVETCLSALLPRGGSGSAGGSLTPLRPGGIQVPGVGFGAGNRPETGGAVMGGGANGRTEERGGMPIVNAAVATDGVAKATAVGTITASVTIPFFAEQLTAFEIWLEFAHRRLQTASFSSASGHLFEPQRSPEQLPVVLQVLLSQAHRVRALILLRRFLDLGPWAVNMALSVGIFPYVLRLLKSDDYKHVLICIWARILAFDPSTQADLVKDDFLPHFIAHLSWGLNGGGGPGAVGAPQRAVQRANNAGGTESVAPPAVDGAPADPAEEDDDARQRILATFIISAIVYDYPPGQADCLKKNLHGTVSHLLSLAERADAESDSVGGRPPPDQRLPPPYRMWLCILLGNLWRDNPAGRAQAHTSRAAARVRARLSDACPDVRAAAAYALGALVGGGADATGGRGRSLRGPGVVGAGRRSPGHEEGIRLDLEGAWALLPACGDASSLVRYEAALALGCVVGKYLDVFVSIASRMCAAPASGAAAPASGSPSTSEFKGKVSLAGTSSMGMLRNGYVPNHHAQSLPGSDLDEGTVEELNHIWTKLRDIQHNDPHPLVSNAAAQIVSVVHENVLQMNKHAEHRMQQQQQPNGGQSSFYHLEGHTSNLPPSRPGSNGGTPVYSRVHSMMSLHVTEKSEPEQQLGAAPLNRSLLRTSTTPDHEQPSAPKVLTQAHRNMSVLDMGSSQSPDVPHQAAAVTTHFDSDATQYSLPVSGFYVWKKRTFRVSSDADDRLVDDDPLSPSGALKLYRQFRNETADSIGQELSERYSCLAPGPSGGLMGTIIARRPQENVYWPGEASYGTPDDEAADAARRAAEEESVAKRSLRLTQSALLRTEAERTGLMMFHGYEPALVICDEGSGVSVWNYDDGVRCCSFGNGNGRGSRMTSVQWIDGGGDSRLLTGCDDGSVRIWNGCIGRDGSISRDRPSLSSAFLTDGTPAEGSQAGLVTEWLPHATTLIAGGDSARLSCWDLEAERCAGSFDRRSEACVTALTRTEGGQGRTPPNSGIGPNIIVAGYGDGTMRVFDVRTSGGVAAVMGGVEGDRPHGRSARRNRLMNYSEHQSWVVDISFNHYGGRYEIVSGCVNGNIKFWDLRMSSSLRTLDVQRSQLTALAIHPGVPLLATGSSAQFVKIMTLDGETINVIRYHNGVSGQRIGPVSHLAFHPNKMLLAAGAANDDIVSLYEEMYSGNL